MPAKKKFPALSVPFKQAGQCDVSWEILDPVIGYVDVEDPDNRRRKTNVSRKAIVLRVDIPAGVAPLSFVPEISSDGKSVVFDCYLERSRYVPDYTLEDHFVDDRGIFVGVQKALQDVWTYITRKQTDAGEIRNYKRYSILLPETVELEFRDPYHRWVANEVGKKGIVYEVKKIRSMFYYSFLFTEASKNVTPATAAVNSLLRMGQSNEDNDMNAQNMAKTNYRIHGEAKRQSSRRRRHRRQPSLEDAFDYMSICSSVQSNQKAKSSTKRHASSSSRRQTSNRPSDEKNRQNKLDRDKGKRRSPRKTRRKSPNRSIEVDSMSHLELQELGMRLRMETERRNSMPIAINPIPPLPTSEEEDSLRLPRDDNDDEESDDESFSTPTGSGSSVYTKGSRSGRSLDDDDLSGSSYVRLPIDFDSRRDRNNQENP